MALYDAVFNGTSNRFRVKLRDSTKNATNGGLTGVSSSSAGLIISTICDGEATATVYTQAGGTIDSITTLGTFSAPTAGHCRIKEVDATNHAGLVEVQFSDSRFSVANSQKMTVTISGVANLVQEDFVITLWGPNPYSANAFITGVNSLTPPANWNLESIDGNGRLDIIKVNGTSQTARDIGASVIAASVTGNVGGNVVGSVGSVTGAVGSVTGNVGGNVTGSVGSVVATVAANLTQILGTALTETAGQLAAAFKQWFNVATPTGTVNSIPNAVAGASSGLAIVGSNVGQATSVSGAVGSVTGAVGSVTGNVGGISGVTVPAVLPDGAHYTNARGDKLDDLDAAVSSRSTYAGGAVASVTGSVGSVTGAVGSVTGNVGGNVTGSVGSVLATVAANVTQFLGTALTETSGQIAAAFKQFFNIATPTGTVNNIPTVGAVSGAVGSVTGAVGSVTGNVGGNVNGNVSGSTGSVLGAVDRVTNSVGSVAGDVAGNLGGKVLGGGAGAITGDGVRAASVTGAVGSVTGATGSVTGAVGSVGGNVGGDVAGKVLGGGAGTISGDGVRASAVSGAVGSVAGSVGSVTGAVGSVTGAVGSVTGNVNTNANATETALASAVAAIPTTPAPTASANATAVLAATVDGVVLATLLTDLWAATGGLLAVTDNGDGTVALSFKRHDGTTQFTHTFNKTTGART